MNPTIDEVVRAFSNGVISENSDFMVTRSLGEPPRAHLAFSRVGSPALLLPLDSAPSVTARLTNGVLLRAAPELEFSSESEHWRQPAAVLECRDTGLMKTFASLVSVIISRLTASDGITWNSVASSFAEWERLLGRRRLLDSESEMGLWGELWLLSRSSCPQPMLEGWRGPEGAAVDYLIDGVGFEVKTSSRLRVHSVSQVQVDLPLGHVETVFVSLFAKPDPLRGRSLSALVFDLSRRALDTAAFEEKLAGVGYSREDESAYHRPFALMEAPGFFLREHVPRVRSADDGVSRLRYQVELSPDAAISPSEHERYTRILGLDMNGLEYPCA